MVNCPICQHVMKRFGELNNATIYKCKNCGFGLTQGVKLQKGDYHRDEVYKTEEKLFRNIFQRRSKIINKIVKRPGKVLEIGCSTGILLSLLKEKGWEVEGVELSKAAAKVAQEKKITVIVEPFEKIKFSKKYDLVILNHTLEHLADPINVVKKINNILSPKGYLYIDVPNFGSLSAKLFKKRWPFILPEEHLWHFTEKALRILLERDFRVVYVNKSSGIWDYDSAYKGLFQSLTGLKKRFFLELLTAKPSWIVTKLGKGSDLMVIARRR